MTQRKPQWLSNSAVSQCKEYEPVRVQSVKNVGNGLYKLHFVGRWFCRHITMHREEWWKVLRGYDLLELKECRLLVTFEPYGNDLGVFRAIFQ